MVVRVHCFGSEVRHVTAAEASGRDYSLHFMATRKQKEEKQEGTGDRIQLSRGTLLGGLTSCFLPPSKDAVT